MPQMNRDGHDNNQRHPFLSAEPWSEEREAEEARIQGRRLALLRNIPFLILPVIIVLGGLLYFGYELLPYGMNTQPADSTGYRPPERTQFGVAGAVPRTGVERVLPDLPDGSIPVQAAALKNPLPIEEATLRRGAISYANNCAFCHGSTGKGNGPVSESYVPGAPDLTTARVQNRPPGALFYQITNGILSTPNPETQRYLPREWHSFKGTITEDDRWAIVAFMKALDNSEVVAMVPSPTDTTHPILPRDTMPGTTNPTGAPGTDPAAAGQGAAGAPTPTRGEQ